MKKIHAEFISIRGADQIRWANKALIISGASASRFPAREKFADQQWPRTAHACAIDFLDNTETDRVSQSRLEYMGNIDDAAIFLQTPLIGGSKKGDCEKYRAPQCASIIWNTQLKGADGGAEMEFPQSA